jgi:GNAT superfamily N-acetyltransferase
MRISVEQAQKGDAAAIAGILQEAALWLEKKGVPLWSADRLTFEKIVPEVENGMFWLAKVDGNVAGCIRFQETDEEYWGDVPHADSAFIHRLAVKREFAGKGIAQKLIEWAEEKAASEGKTYLRLDCADRPNLRLIYESYGFKFHSIKEKEPYPVVRYELRLRK